MITKYTKKEILRYNLIDALATFYIYEKYKKERHSRPYREIFKPSLYALIKMMLVGLPMDSDRVQEVHTILAAKEKALNEQIQENNYVNTFVKCGQCNAPDTIFIREERTTLLKCQACGATRPVKL